MPLLLAPKSRTSSLLVGLLLSSVLTVAATFLAPAPPAIRRRLPVVGDGAADGEAATTPPPSTDDARCATADDDDALWPSSLEVHVARGAARAVRETAQWRGGAAAAALALRLGGRILNEVTTAGGLESVMESSVSDAFPDHFCVEYSLMLPR